MLTASVGLLTVVGLIQLTNQSLSTEKTVIAEASLSSCKRPSGSESFILLWYMSYVDDSLLSEISLVSSAVIASHSVRLISSNTDCRTEYSILWIISFAIPEDKKFLVFCPFMITKANLREGCPNHHRSHDEPDPDKAEI